MVTNRKVIEVCPCCGRNTVDCSACVNGLGPGAWELIVAGWTDLDACTNCDERLNGTFAVDDYYTNCGWRYLDGTLTLPCPYSNGYNVHVIYESATEFSITVTYTNFGTGYVTWVSGVLDGTLADCVDISELELTKDYDLPFFGCATPPATVKLSAVL